MNQSDRRNARTEHQRVSCSPANGFPQKHVTFSKDSWPTMSSHRAHQETTKKKHWTGMPIELRLVQEVAFHMEQHETSTSEPITDLQTNLGDIRCPRRQLPLHPRFDPTSMDLQKPRSRCLHPMPVHEISQDILHHVSPPANNQGSKGTHRLLHHETRQR